MPPDTLRLARGNAMCRSNGLNRRARKSSMIYFERLILRVYELFGKEIVLQK